VSVVIPTFDRPESLRRTLAGVARAARRLEESVEAVVVYDGDALPWDGDPEESTVDGLRIRRLRAGAAGVSGSAEARNVGVAAACYDVIAFTDDDAVPDEWWLARGVRRLRTDSALGGVEGAIRIDPDAPLDPVRARIVMNVRGGAFMTASLFLRRAAIERVGGFWRLPNRNGLRVPYREDTDLALRIIKHVGPIPFDPDAFVLHPPEPVGVDRLVRLARYFVVDAAFARRHPDAVPGLLERPLTRLRIRLATAATLLLPGLLHRRSRRTVAAAILVVAAAVSAQFEIEAHSAGNRRSLRARLLDSVRRLPRALLWLLTAGAARVEGEALVRLGLVDIPQGEDGC
jgi:GT2 family glycosyltransferase